VREKAGGQELVLESDDGGAADDRDADADGDGLDGLRALCVAHWARHPDEAAPA